MNIGSWLIKSIDSTIYHQHDELDSLQPTVISETVNHNRRNLKNRQDRKAKVYSRLYKHRWWASATTTPQTLSLIFTSKYRRNSANMEIAEAAQQ